MRAVFLKPAGFLAVLLAGWALGRMRPSVNLPLLALTMFAAVTAHSAMQSAFVEGRLHEALGDPRDGASEAVIVPIAAGEAVGLWVTFVVVPWARFGARLWVGLYVLATATLAAAAFYFPFDTVIFNEQVVAPDGPPYLLAVIVLLPAGGVGYLIGWLRSHHERSEV